MSTYSGNCLSFRGGSVQSRLTNAHSSETDMVFELIGIICTPHPRVVTQTVPVTQPTETTGDEVVPVTDDASATQPTETTGDEVVPVTQPTETTITIYEGLLSVSDYLATHPDANPAMTQEEYTAFVTTTVQSFADLLTWCKTHDVTGDFNNFETGWSISMSVYS